jgi:large subunit ribosomal protein L13
MTTRTFRLSGRELDRSWHVLDAKDVPLGRLASEASKLLLGKHKPTYEPHLAMGDFVIVVNAGEVRLSGDKAQTKVYYRHTGYPGGLRERTAQEQLDRDPRRVIEMAVRGMLPHNSRGRELFRHLKVYRGPDHPHQAQLRAGTGARAKKRTAQEQTQAARAAAGTATRRRRARPAVADEPAPDAAAAEAAAVETAQETETDE